MVAVKQQSGVAGIAVKQSGVAGIAVKQSSGVAHMGSANTQQSMDTGILVEKINHSSGKVEWKIMPSDYDYSRELARASFADMLHDSERNHLYRLGLQAAIKKVKERGDKVRVLDIGTGTGLLSMMAAVEGVDSIVACEEFRPMAECAQKIIQLNGFKDKIKLVRKRSTELTVGPGCDLEERANILVTEVFDTELIGEGAIGTYNHANRELLTPDRIVVPGIARMFAQVVSCNLASKWSILQDIDCGDGKIVKFDGKYRITNLVLHDVQLSQLEESDFTPISEPIQVFNFDLACKNGPIPEDEETVQEFTASCDGKVTAVFMWWDCYTDPDNSILLSCAPYWSHKDKKEQAWRDHWMQAIYFPKSEIQVEKGESLELISNHDEYSLWFDVINKKQETSRKDSEDYIYMPMSRTRLFQVNDSGANQKHIQAIQSISTEPLKNILCLGDQSVMGLVMAASVSSAHVTILQENKRMEAVLKDMIEENDLSSRIHVYPEIQDLPSEVCYDAVVCDMFFTGSVLSWHNLLAAYHIRQLKNEGRIKGNCSVLPGKFHLWLLPVHYSDLWKIRAPLHNIEGFHMKHFDDIIDKASDTCDENVEPQPLWEYPCTALAHPIRVATLNLSDPLPDNNISYTGTVDLECKDKELNGLALWSTWDLTDDLSINTGPLSDIILGKQVEWNKGHKQGVHLFKEHKIAQSMTYTITFLPAEGDFKFEFSVVQ